jgi:hypothetical protein
MPLELHIIGSAIIGGICGIVLRNYLQQKCPPDGRWEYIMSAPNPSWKEVQEWKKFEEEIKKTI